MEIETEAGIERPVFANIELPVMGNVVHIVNKATVTLSFSCNTDPLLVGTEGSHDIFVISEELGTDLASRIIFLDR
jgi:hypothetical protein